MSLAEKLKNVETTKKRVTPLWTGPNGDGPNGGVTQGLINKFLTCPERLRVLAVEGLKTNDTFNHRIEYGSMWHVCEEALAKEPPANWREALIVYCKNLCKKYTTQQAEVDKWYQICIRQFPVYVEHWRRHPDVTNRQPILQEYKFDEGCELPTGRFVRLRGKFDSVDVIDGGIYLQENKTKGDIDELQLQRQLKSGFDLQTMMYLTALGLCGKSKELGPIKGVRYNVVRRPLGGGKGSIRQHLPSRSNPHGENSVEFYDRLARLIQDARGAEWGVSEHDNYFFRRWKIHISDEDINRFAVDTLNPVLENICSWWQTIVEPSITNRAAFQHFRMPYGVYSPVLDGGETDIDDYINTGNKVGLCQTNVMFPELH